jgi:hypothetical protein
MYVQGQGELALWEISCTTTSLEKLPGFEIQRMHRKTQNKTQNNKFSTVTLFLFLIEFKVGQVIPLANWTFCFSDQPLIDARNMKRVSALESHNLPQQGVQTNTASRGR